MKKKCTPHIIAAVSFMVFIVLGLACATTADKLGLTLVNNIDFNYYEQFRKSDERLVYVCGTAIDVDVLTLFVFTNKNNFDKINKDIKKWANRITYNNQTPGIITGTAGKYSPVYLKANETTSWLAVFSLPKEEKVPMLIVALGARENSSNNWTYSWSMSQFDLHATEDVWLIVSDKDITEGDPLLLSNIYDKAFDSGYYGYILGKKSQTGFIEIKNEKNNR